MLLASQGYTISMVRVLYLIENGSCRLDHRTRQEVCSPNLLGIYEDLYPGQLDRTGVSCASA